MASNNARLTEKPSRSLPSIPVVTISMDDLYDGPTYAMTGDVNSIGSGLHGIQKLLIQNDEKRIRSDSSLGVPSTPYSCDLDELSLITRTNEDIFPALYASNSFSLSDEARFHGDLFDRVSFATELQRAEATGHHPLSISGNRSTKPPPMDIQSIDFFGSGDAIKQLISLPYIQDHGSNVFAFHRMGNALLVDSIAGSHGGQQSDDMNNFDNFFQNDNGSHNKRGQRDESLILNLISSSSASRKALSAIPESSSATAALDSGLAAMTNSNSQTTQDPTLLETFTYATSSAQESSVMATESSPGYGIHSESISERSVIALESPNSPPPELWMPSESVPSPPKQIVKWNLHDMKLAVGTDLTLFKTPDQRIITLNSVDTTQPFELSTCLDLYLDNVMANVPELALALHSKGFVRGLRVCETKDIPYLSSESLIDSLMMDSNLTSPLLKPSTSNPESLLFDPKVIDSDATAIMRFLKTACNKEDGTYILTKSARGQSLQLFDLGAASGTQQKQFKWMLAMISYRFAVRLGHLQQLGVTTTASRIQLRHRQMKLFETCYKILEEIKHLCDPTEYHPGSEQYGTIRASVLEQMADCYLSRIALVANKNNDSLKRDNSASSSSSSSSSSRTRLSDNTGERIETQSELRAQHEDNNNDQVYEDEEEFDYLGSCYLSVRHLIDGISCLEPLIQRDEASREEKEKQEEPEILFGSFHTYGSPLGVDGLVGELFYPPTTPENLPQMQKINMLDLMEQITGAVHKLIRAVRCIVLDRIKNTRVAEALEIMFTIVPSLNAWTRCRYALYRDRLNLRGTKSSPPTSNGSVHELNSSRISMVYSLPILWNIFGEVCREISKHTGGISLDADLDIHLFPGTGSHPNVFIPNTRVSVRDKVCSVLDSLRAVSICFSSLSLSGAQSNLPTGGISFDEKDLFVLLKQSEAMATKTIDVEHRGEDENGQSNLISAHHSPGITGSKNKDKKKKNKSGTGKFVSTDHHSKMEAIRLLTHQIDKDWWSLVPALVNNPTVSIRKYFLNEVVIKEASYRSLDEANHSLDSSAILYPLHILHQLIAPMIFHQQQAAPIREALEGDILQSGDRRYEARDHESHFYKLVGVTGIARAIKMHPHSDLEVACKMAYSFLLGALTHVNHRAQDLLSGPKSNSDKRGNKQNLRSPLLAQQQGNMSPSEIRNKKTATGVDEFLKSFDANLKSANQIGHQQCNSSFKECIRRLADSCNVIGQRLLSIISVSVSKLDSSTKNSESENEMEIVEGFIHLAKSVMRCGVDLFAFVDDSMNASMIRCNICALVRLQVLHLVSGHSNVQQSGLALALALALGIQTDAITFARNIEYTLMQKCSPQQQHSKTFSIVLHACRSELALLLLSAGVFKRALLPPRTVSQSMQLYYRDKLLSPLSCTTHLNESTVAGSPGKRSSLTNVANNALQSKDTAVLESLYQGLRLFERLDDLRHCASTHFQIGSYYMSTISLSSEVFYHPVASVPDDRDEGIANEKREDRAMMHYREAYHYYVKNDIGPNLVIILIDMCDLYLNSFQSTESNYKIQQLLSTTAGKVDETVVEQEGEYLLPLAGGALQAVIETKMTFCTAVLSRYGNQMEALACEVISRTLQIFLLLFKLAAKGCTSPCPADIRTLYLSLAQDCKLPEMQAGSWSDSSLSSPFNTGILPSKRILEVLESLHTNKWINDNFM